MSALLELLPRTVDGLILSAPLVPPTLDGRKTVTRRMSRKWLKRKVGELLFVRETWYDDMFREPGEEPERLDDGTVDGIEYRATHDCRAWEAGCPCNPDGDGKRSEWRSPIHLPKWASRCVLRITEKPRVEPVQAITAAEIVAEGFDIPDVDYTVQERPDVLDFEREQFAIGEFRKTWEKLHKKPGERWQDNPTVVRIAFERAA